MTKSLRWRYEEPKKGVDQKHIFFPKKGELYFFQIFVSKKFGFIPNNQTCRILNVFASTFLFLSRHSDETGGFPAFIFIACTYVVINKFQTAFPLPANAVSLTFISIERADVKRRAQPSEGGPTRQLEPDHC